jgi:Mrp family chromosome partitioning ATPase
MIMLGLMIGAAIGASIVLVRTLTKGTYTSISELEHDVNLPVLTALPERGWTSLREALRDVSSDRFGETAEGIRRLRNELAITDQDAEIQSIALLSPLQDEGKTMTTVLLAHMTAQSDRLVVVVDCDFRRNTIQAEFNFEMPYDFGDVLLGDCSVVEALHTETRLGFDLLAVRNRQPEAVEMLTSETLQDIIAELKRYYDVVFVNCPAVLPAAESLAIARAVDQRVLLARYDSTPRKAMQRCLTVLENNRLDVTGQVLTRVDPNMLHDNAVYAYDTSS